MVMSQGKVGVMMTTVDSGTLNFKLSLLFLGLLSALTWCSVVVSGASVEGGSGHNGVSQGNNNGGPKSSSALFLLAAAPAQRAKRSRDAQQQLCGYRLLDALRSVCDRNFVGFTRRSDPSFIFQSREGQSGEDNNIRTGGDWDALTLEYPQYMTQPPPPSSFSAGGEGGNWDDMDGLLGMPVATGLMPGTSSFSLIWPASARNGQAASGNTNGNKAFALKMLAESPKTHQRFRRNIIDECCKKPCGAQAMLKYCAITAAGKRSFNF